MVIQEPWPNALKLACRLQLLCLCLSGSGHSLFGYKNIHHNENVCLIKTELHAQYILTI